MNDPNSGQYTSMPLAQAQEQWREAEAAAATDREAAPDPVPPAAPDRGVGVQAAPASGWPEAPGGPVRRMVPTVDFEFDKLPEQHFEDYAFTIPPVTGGIVYVLGIEDDNELVELIDTFNEESSLATIINDFFEATFKYALNADGTEVADSEQFFFDLIAPEPKSGQMVPRKKLMDMIAEAVDKWSAELTDTSMRPNRRTRRSRRRG